MDSWRKFTPQNTLERRKGKIKFQVYDYGFNSWYEFSGHSLIGGLEHWHKGDFYVADGKSSVWRLNRPSDG